MSRYLDLHVLQTVPPSNVNRDDTGSPKTAVYGGVRRARVSSQSWKRAVRRAFVDLLETDELGYRTKRMYDLLVAEIIEQAPDLGDQASKAAEAVFTALKIKLTEPKTPAKAKGAEPDDTPPRSKETSYLLFLSRHQLQNLAALTIEATRAGSALDAKQAKRLADTSLSVDVALFGRMVAEDTDRNVDACAQVAHALSVHGVDNEFDYFTAMDDLPLPEQSGAGMIGTVEFNSSTLYRYATVDLSRLREALGDDEATRRAVAAFVEGFITSMPTGKQNTFAHRTLPDAVVVQLRSDQPVNLVGAFESPVTTTASRLKEAATRLADHSRELSRAFGATPERTWVVAVSDAREALTGVGQDTDLATLLAEVRLAVPEAVTV